MQMIRNKTLNNWHVKYLLKTILVITGINICNARARIIWERRVSILLPVKRLHHPFTFSNLFQRLCFVLNGKLVSQRDHNESLQCKNLHLHMQLQKTYYTHTCVILSYRKKLWAPFQSERVLLVRNQLSSETY